MVSKQLLIVAAACVFVGLAGPAQATGDAAAGKTKSAQCAGCHGADGRGNASNPPVAGMSAADHVKAMQAYRSGARKHPVMEALAKGLSEKDIADLAAYYASLK